jgi:hypothetical protein
MQRLLKQHAPPAHCPPVQQRSPTSPQRVQSASAAVDEQNVPGSHGVGPMQQATPRVPQAAQKPERQARPAWQLVPQQAWPSAPQAAHLPALQVPAGAALVPQAAPAATQVPALQQAPAEQLPSAQHGAPDTPQAAQVSVAAEQTSPDCRQVAGAVPTAGQHGSPAFCPQAEQVPVAHRVPGAVHSDGARPTLALQHERPAPPQPPQAPFAQTPGRGAQLAPLAAQRPETQQPPPAHRLPPQQGWPGVPQGGPMIRSPPPASRGASSGASVTASGVEPGRSEAPLSSTWGSSGGLSNGPSSPCGTSS